MKFKTTRIVVDGVIIEGSKICLVRRAGPPFRNYWVVPGGFVETGEVLKDAVRREVWEETGLRTRVVNLSGIYDDPKRDPRGHAVSVAFLLRRAGGRIRTSSETSDVKFFPIRRLPKNIGFDHRQIIRDALKVYKRKRSKRGK
jgi:8-oxo-dGTP diphosphatase